MKGKTHRRKSRIKGEVAGQKPFSTAKRETMIGQVIDLAEPLCQAEGLELVHVEYQRETAGRTLRIYIDKPGGVALDDCVRISRQLSDLLDVYTENSDSYRLEVSSSGPDRPLGRAHDFEKFKGNQVRIRTAQPIDGQKSFTGRLLGLTEGVVDLMITDKTVAIPFREIKKARLINHNGEN